jgi:tetratricopeptide (TPR) repeat protein
MGVLTLFMMTRNNRDPLENEIEQAFRPGAFIPDRACFSFVVGLEAVAARIDEIAQTEAARATALYETFLAGCYGKAEELDDSSGSFGQFAADLICRWIKGRQALGADRRQMITRLLFWMDDDPYGFCSGIEENAVKVFDPAGMAAFETEMRTRFESAAGAGQSSGRWGRALRALYREQENIAAYIGITEQSGLTVEDCQTLSKLQISQAQPKEALGWVERGIDLDSTPPHGSSAVHELAKLRRELLVRLGRADEALATAWAEYQAFPDKYRYSELMRIVPENEREVWHAKAIDAAQGATLGSLLELLVETGETQRLAQAVCAAAADALEHLSHYVTEPVAEALEEACPGLAARLWRAQGLRIVNGKKSKYYDAALSNFERAYRFYERAGLDAEWVQLVLEVRARHRRKVAFLSGFEAVVAGRRTAPLSFLELAKSRWNKAGGEENS